MHRTVFSTPLINTLLRTFSVCFLCLTGWKVEGSLPAGAQKSVLIAAPHTSNWDLPYTLMVAFALRLNIYWMGKEQLFKPPFRGLMMWLGGIPVAREKSSKKISGLGPVFAPSGDLEKMPQCAHTAALLSGGPPVSRTRHQRIMLTNYDFRRPFRVCGLDCLLSLRPARTVSTRSPPKKSFARDCHGHD